jgi:CRISPR-associated protein Csx10
VGSGWGPLDFEALERLEETGVGERTDEGFGELMVCHPFHLEVEPV